MHYSVTARLGSFTAQGTCFPWVLVSLGSLTAWDSGKLRILRFSHYRITYISLNRHQKIVYAAHFLIKNIKDAQFIQEKQILPEVTWVISRCL